MKQQDKIFMVVGSTAVLVTAGITGAWLFGKTNATTATTSSVTASSEDTTTTPSAPTASTTATSSSSSATTSAVFKDGTYKASTSYMVPHGSNSLTASVTISGGKVTSVSVNHDYADQESGRYIDSFESVLQGAVVGKSVDGLSLSRIGGASLTTQAFDDALITIRTDAKV